MKLSGISLPTALKGNPAKNDEYPRREAAVRVQGPDRGRRDGGLQDLIPTAGKLSTASREASALPSRASLAQSEAGCARLDARGSDGVPEAAAARQRAEACGFAAVCRAERPVQGKGNHDHENHGDGRHVPASLHAREVRRRPAARLLRCRHRRGEAGHGLGCRVEADLDDDPAQALGHDRVHVDRSRRLQRPCCATPRRARLRPS